ncbi:hypothetical protein JAAARDRAFT_703348 [Jaapia argillacea MUCL 33604]|uniref:L-lysine epsilon oxidase C-terminal domain-containing protein n=1 Tax=Jaapia argillacea MUCL 33604 TaxID=933084 RepID=A0A067PBN8_9AGAM|nr:hypothetical protein JAAARDRAFT_703348 [Jaapia argillacea MUCL 33604]
METFNPFDVASVKIFPPIGVARVGDSGFDLEAGVDDGDIKFFMPPEIPGVEDVPPELQGNFRDEMNRIKRQAIRFHVYAYNASGKILGEVTTANGFSIAWKVHVVNSKGSFTEFKGKYKTPTEARHGRDRLIVDPGVKTIIADPRRDVLQIVPTVKLTGDFYGSRDTPTEVNLGELRTDERGCLVFIAGAGYSRCISNPDQPHYQPDIVSEFDSIDWVDDVCDGWVDATVTFSGFGHTGLHFQAKEKATVMSAPPKFAWGINSPTSLYDIIEDIYQTASGWKDHTGTQFYEDIWPVLYGTYGLSWVNEKAYQGHGPAGKGNFLPLQKDLAQPETGSPTSPDVQKRRILREFIFGRLRKPNYEDKTEASTKFMPRLSGDDGDAIEPGQPLRPGEPIRRFSALTGLQYSRFEKWRQGNFKADDPPWKKYTKIEDVPISRQPAFLTRAALEHTTGDPLYPGIEVYWLAKDPSIYILPGPYNIQQIEVLPPYPEPPFRIDYKSVKPGHLSRGLSLPWQSDFDLCNTHWWPSARPDDAINIMNWRASPQLSDDEFVRMIADKRKQWDRGTRVTPDYPSEYYPGSTDMIRYWQKLGFVSKHEGYTVGGFPVWLERERLPIDNKAGVGPVNFDMPIAL